MPDPDPVPIPSLLDERARPDVADVFRSLMLGAREVDVALMRIRLSGIRIGPAELAGVRRLRLLVAEMNALTLAREAEGIAIRPDRRRTLRFLLGLLRDGRVEIRRSPLGGWSPDFSVFSGADGPGATLVGLHWFERPCPHPGPVLAAVHGAEAARALSIRFRELWEGAHDVAEPVLGIMETADARTPADPDERPPEGSRLAPDGGRAEGIATPAQG